MDIFTDKVLPSERPGNQSGGIASQTPQTEPSIEGPINRGG